MKTTKNRNYGIVTGDVVGSSRLQEPVRKKLHRALGEASNAVLKAFPEDVPHPVDVFRGDSWQFVLSNPARSLRIALFYRAALVTAAPKGIDTRLAIAIGRVDFVPERVSEGDGVAYRLSGQKLDSLGKRHRMSFAFPGHPAEECLATIVLLLDGLVSGWTPSQARATTGALQGWSQKQIALECWKKPISQQAVAQNLASGSWSYLETALEFVEKALAGTGTG